MRSLPLISLVACLCAPMQAAAEEVATPRIDEKKQDDPLEVHGDEILVLAPRIIGQIEVPQQPIEVFDEEDIAAYGANSIEELIDAISPQTGSGRGRGDGRPVMLLNGQRITNFREMRNIPPEAIRRMEVLPEEVALRFGYPANQRVVNIILKTQFAAATGSGEYNRPTRGGYDNYELESGLFRIAGPRRYNVTAKLDETSMLTEDERDVRQASANSGVAAGVPSARYRSLAAADHEFSLEGTMTQGLGEDGLGGAITASGGYTRSQTTSLSGLDPVALGEGIFDPLTTRVTADKFEAGLGLNKMLGSWQFSLTGDGTYTETQTRADRRLDDSSASTTSSQGGLVANATGAGVDVARSRALSLTSLATLSGTPFRLPAGEANLTVKAGYELDRTVSNDTRTMLGSTRLARGDVQGGVNLALPLTSQDFLGGIGEVTLNFSGGLDHLSDFGTLTDWSAGVTWSPTGTLTLQASYLVNDAAPTLAQLGAPTILNYNVPVYDFTKGASTLVTVTTGGNANLVAEKQRDIKVSAQWKLPFLDRSNLIVEYFHNRSSNVSQAFPLLTPAIEAAFPGRVTRDDAGNLIAVDRRAVTFDEVSSSRLRWGVNLSGSLGKSADTGGKDRDRSAAASLPPRNTLPAQSTIGPNGPLPVGGAAGETGLPSGPPRAFDSSRFAAIREKLCTPGNNPPDISGLTDGLRARLSGIDGKIDPAKLAQFKVRACSDEGPGQSGFDPERFARLRTLLCAGGTPDLANLPERMAKRLQGSDGKIDPVRLAEARERMCSGNAPGVPGARGEGSPPLLERPDGPPPPRDPGAGTGRADGASSGATSQTALSGPGSGRGSGRMGSGGMGAGGGGLPMMMGGGRRGMGSRWNFSIYHTWRFTDRVQVASGLPVLDELAGDAITAGGVPRHTIEAEGGLFKNGYGLRLKAEWNAPARVKGSGLPGSSDLRFGSTFDVSMRLFADLGRNEDLVSKVPFLKGSRLSLKADNLLDLRQKVTDENGQVPVAYQAAYREPQGRVIGIDFRKMF